MAAGAALSVPPPLMLSTLLRAASSLRSPSPPSLGSVLSEAVEATLPHDETAVTSLRNLSVAVTQLWPRPARLLLSRFSSRSDLAESLLVSCHLPLLLERTSLARPLRGDGLFVDGGLGAVVPPLDGAVYVLAFPPSWMGPLLPSRVREAEKRGDVVSLSARMAGNPVRLMRLALGPPTEEELREVFAEGEEEADKWADRRGL